MDENLKIRKGTIGRIEMTISSIYCAFEAIEQDIDEVKFRGDGPPLSFAHIDLFLLNDALIVLQNCAPSFEKIPDWKNEQVILTERLQKIVQSKYSQDEKISIIQQALEARIEDFENYVAVLPKNISPDGDGFGNLLSKRHSIEALLTFIELETGESKYRDNLIRLDELLKKGAESNWLGEPTCEYQILNLAPLSRRWFYKEE